MSPVMQPVPLPRLLVVALAALVAALGLAAGQTFTVFGEPPGTTFYACLTKGATLTQVSTQSAPSCKAGDTLLSWRSYSGADLDVAYVNDNAGEVDAADLATDSVTSAAVRDGTLQSSDVAPGAFDAAYVNEGQANSVSGAMIGDGQVGSADLETQLYERLKCGLFPKQGVDLSFCDLDGVNYGGYNLRGANLNRVQMVHAFLEGTILNEAEVNHANLTLARLRDAHLAFAHIQFTFLGQADLTNADLTGADLTGTSLQDADLTNAYLGGANLSAADLLNVIWNNTTCPDGTNTDTNGGTCEGHRTP